MEYYGNYYYEEEMCDFGFGGFGLWMDYYFYYEYWEGNMMEMFGEFMYGYMCLGMGVDGYGFFFMGFGMFMCLFGVGFDFGMFFGGFFGMLLYERY